MDSFFSIPNLIYWTLIIVTVCITTPTLGKLWKRQENYRWTTGYFIIFFWSFPFVMAGRLDANTWLTLFFGVGFAGIIKVGYESLHNSQLADRIRRAFKLEQEG